MFRNMTTVTQGSIGLGMAIAWFVENGYTVSIPLNDNQSYDIVVDKNDGLKRIQVKTTKFKERNSPNYTVQLKSVRSNKTKNNIKKFDSDTCEFVFIVTEEKDKYLIPSKELHGLNSLSLGLKRDKWKLS